MRSSLQIETEALFPAHDEVQALERGAGRALAEVVEHGREQDALFIAGDGHDHAVLAGHGGGDFFLVEDFVNAIRTGSKPDIDVYQACEWTAVGLLSELSVMNGGRTMDMPDFRKHAVQDQIVKL